MNDFEKGNVREFKKLKESALDLLEWSLEDISPDPARRLHLKMGIEREGHFIPPEVMRIPRSDTDGWKEDKRRCLEDLADHLAHNVLQRGGKNLERIYLDESGTFHLEMTTSPVSPKEAALSAIRNSALMIELANEYGVEKAKFGTIKVNFLQKQVEQAERAFTDYYSEVFKSPDDGSLLLAGQAQHVNVSVWCGDKNLCYTSPFSGTGQHTLGDAMVRESIRMMPGMMLPSRKNNHLRIAGQAYLSVQDIDVKVNHKGCALNWVEETDPLLETGPKSDYARLEFRQASSDASPLDTALAAAIPVTKACMECIKQKGGKAVISKKGEPQIIADRIAPHCPSKMPHTHEEAAAMFKEDENSNFTFLDELAARKIKKLEDKYKATGLRADQLALKEARETLQGIGTKLHHGYCQQYGLKSGMELPKVRCL